MKKLLFLPIFSLMFWTCSQESLLDDSTKEYLEVQAASEHASTPSGPILSRESLEIDKDGFYVMGDMLLTEDQVNELFNPTDAASSTGFRRWPNCLVTYKIHPTNPPTNFARQNLFAAMRQIEGLTNIRFRYAARFAPRSSYLEVRGGDPNDGGGSATVGKVSSSRLSLDGNAIITVARHELGHVLGFKHEHQRSDANLFLTYQLGNLNGAQNCSNMSNVARLPSVNVHHTPYDFNSVMHYWSCLCNGGIGGGCTNANSIFLRRADNTRIGVNFDFSDGDIASLNAIYNCGTPPGNPTDPIDPIR